MSSVVVVAMSDDENVTPQSLNMNVEIEYNVRLQQHSSQLGVVAAQTQGCPAIAEFHL